jgi:hypothetical protein
VFPLRFDNVFLGTLLGESTFFHDVSYSHIEGGYEAKTDPFLRGKVEVAASAYNDGTSM